ncbi:MAG: 30S ribosomal protein S8 [Verrucomicrobiales bacterium]|jgi:small subunit ribosomal protein S8|nr:30S ribosomal protein S8 [Verrucomicrobiales bacterium]
MQTDPLADFLTQIRNASRADKPEVIAPYSRVKSDVADILVKEGFINGSEIVKIDDRQRLKLTLKNGSKQKALHGLKRVSRPGLRRYVGAADIPRVLGGLGVAILSTSKGVLSGHEAKKQNVGGELLLYVW